MGEGFCSEEVCSSVLEFSKGVLGQVFEEFEKALITRAFARLRFEVRLTRLLVEIEVVFEHGIVVVFDYKIEVVITRSKSYSITRSNKRDRSRNRLLHRNWIRKQFVAVCVC